MFRALLLMITLASGPALAADAAPRVVLDTSAGAITVELDAKLAPGTVKNFLDYVSAGFYAGTIFHRVIPNFMIQGGGFTVDMTQKDTRGTIKNEAGNGLLNARGTIAMARRGDPHSASAQFFINLADNSFLDHQDDSVSGYGYAVFGKVVDGMQVVDAIAATPTSAQGPLEDVPTKPIVIKSARLVTP